MLYSNMPDGMFSYMEQTAKAVRSRIGEFAFAKSPRDTRACLRAGSPVWSRPPKAVRSRIGEFAFAKFSSRYSNMTIEKPHGERNEDGITVWG